jgi:hypothetical protein
LKKQVKEKVKIQFFLILDGHNSRWTVEAIEYLHENNVWAFFIPSHSSTVSQPNDCGMNFIFHVFVAHAANYYSNAVYSCSPCQLNVIIKRAWEKYIESERDEFISTGENVAIHAWRFCGYAPFNKECEAWRVYLSRSEDVREVADEIKKERNESVEKIHYDVCPKENIIDILSTMRNDKFQCDALFDGYEEYVDTIGAECRVAFLRCTSVLSQYKNSKSTEIHPRDLCTDEGDRVALKLMNFLKTHEYEIRPSPIDSICSKEKVIRQVERYLYGVKAFVEGVPIEYVCEDGSISDGLATKGRNNLWNIVLEDATCFENVEMKSMLDDDKVKVKFITTKEMRNCKRVAAMLEREKEKEAKEIAALRRETHLYEQFNEFSKEVMERSDGLLTYSDYVHIGDTFNSPFTTVVNDWNITIDPLLKNKNKEYNVVGCAVRESVKEILSCVQNHRDLADARVQAEVLKRKNDEVKGVQPNNSNKKSKAQSERSMEKLKAQSERNTDEIESDYIKMNKSPNTQMGSNSIHVEHHLKHWSKNNNIMLKIELEKSLKFQIKKKEKALDDFDAMKKLNETVVTRCNEANITAPRMWYDWKCFVEDCEDDEDDFKVLCRLMAPKAGIIGKSIALKKAHFENVNCTKLLIEAERERMGISLRDDIKKLEELKCSDDVENMDANKERKDGEL